MGAAGQRIKDECFSNFILCTLCWRVKGPDRKSSRPAGRLVDTKMRLGANEAKTICEQIRQSDPAAEIYLFGSRADDSAKGGDIDLLVVSDKLGFRDVLKLRTAILDRIGWQQLDVVVRRRNQLSEPLAAVAMQTGVKL